MIKLELLDGAIKARYEDGEWTLSYKPADMPPGADVPGAIRRKLEALTREALEEHRTQHGAQHAFIARHIAESLPGTEILEVSTKRLPSGAVP